MAKSKKSKKEKKDNATSESSSAKQIEQFRMSEKMKMDQYAGAISTSVSLVAFLAAISFFFSGLLLTGEISNTPARSVSLSLLFASAFGFLFSALFYSNTAGKSVIGVMDHKQTAQGNILSEYFGVYGLIFATPLAIYSYSGDFFMSVVVAVLVASGTAAYQTLGNGTSIIERYFSFSTVVFVTFFLIASAAIQIWGALIEKDWLIYVATAVLWGIIIALTVISWSREELFQTEETGE